MIILFPRLVRHIHQNNTCWKDKKRSRVLSGTSTNLDGVRNLHRNLDLQYAESCRISSPSSATVRPVASEIARTRIGDDYDIHRLTLAKLRCVYVWLSVTRCHGHAATLAAVISDK